jgi:hypothetical protein
MDPEVIGKIAERKIQEAMEEGKFDNLPGKGQPIVFEEDAALPMHIRLANKVLKNAGALPDWIQVQKDIQTERQEIAALRARLIRENERRRATLLDLPAYHVLVRDFASWHAKSREEYHKRLKRVNNDLLKLSLMAPSTLRQPAPYRIAPEMAAFDEVFPPLPQMHPETPELEPRRESELRGIARERYQAGQGGPIGGWLKSARRFSRPEKDVSSEELELEDVRPNTLPRASD